jgi:hypothetical protein
VTFRKKEEAKMRNVLVKGPSRRWVVAVLGVVVIAAVAVTAVFTLTRNHSVGAEGAGPCSALADGTPSCHARGFFTAAGAYKVDTSTCPSGVATLLHVYVNESVIHQGKTISTSSVAADITSWNSCTSTYAAAYGYTLTPTLQVKGQTGGATLQATVPVSTSWGGTPNQTLTINVTWTGIGPVYAATTSNDYRGGDFFFKMRETGDSRNATVAGSISDGTTTYSISDPSEIFTIHEGTLLIVHA